jgi:hypothetical protein
MSRHVATFATPYDADRVTPGVRPVAVKVIAIIVDEDSTPSGGTPAASVAYVVVDHDPRTAIVPAGELVFTDSSVQPPRYG